MIRVGSILGAYRLDAVVGEGATATVYAATHLAEARRVALKVLSPRLRDNPRLRDRFREAARLQQSLRHEHVVEVEDVVDEGGEIMLVLPLLEGGTLADGLSDGLADDRATAILRQVAAALDFAHAAGIVHGDVKPSNVLLDGDGRALVGDFGLATAVSRPALDARGAPGTIAYSAPERLRGETPTPRSDVYSLACVLFEALTGEVPFAHGSAPAVVGGHLYNAPPLVSGRRPEATPELDEVLLAGLAKDPAARPASASALVEAAAAALERVPPRPARAHAPAPAAGVTRVDDETIDEPLTGLPEPPVIEVDEPAGLSRGALVAGVLALVAAGVLGAWLGSRSSTEEAEERFAGGGRVSFALPDGWMPGQLALPPGLALERPAVIVPEGRARRVAFVVGAARTQPPDFLPRSLLDRLQRRPRRSLVELDGGVAYRYARPAPPGFGGALTVFVLPGPTTSALAACIAPRAREPLLAECEGLARSLRVRRGRPFDPTPDRSFAAAVSGALRVLRVARISGLELLRGAATRRGQARAATEIAVAYRTTVASMGRARPPAIVRAATERLVEALDRAGVGYTRLAGSTRRGDPDAYGAAQNLVLAAETDVRDARADIAALGYGG